MLDWLENPNLRRRCHAGLNNSEQRHALTQAIYTFRQGRIIDRSHEAQQYRASGLNLVIAAIVYWNKTYMGAAVQHLRSESRSEEHTSELQSLMRISYAVFCLKKQKNNITDNKPYSN